MSIARSLARIRLFAGLQDVHLGEIAKLAEVRKYDAGDTVFHEGDAGTHLFCVVSGRVELCLTILEQRGDQVLVDAAVEGIRFRRACCSNGQTVPPRPEPSNPSRLWPSSRRRSPATLPHNRTPAIRSCTTSVASSWP